MKRPGACHTATYRGKTVHVILRDGTTFVDKFLERTPGKWVIFQRRGRVRAGAIRSMSDRKLKP